jgi:hypothetical protein
MLSLVRPWAGCLRRRGPTVLLPVASLTSAIVTTAHQHTAFRFASTDTNHTDAVLRQFDADKSGFAPDMLDASALVKSVRPAWWKCGDCDWSWQQRFVDRLNPAKDIGCPRCALVAGAKGPKARVPTTLAAASPVAAREWHAVHNLELTHLTPETIPASSTALLWWTCTLCRADFNATVVSRTSSDASSCPSCAAQGQKPLATPRARSIAGPRTEEAAMVPTSRGTLARFATPFNECLSPDRDALSCDDTAPVEWRCSACAETYQETPRRRCRAGVGCPSCRGARNTELHDVSRARPDVLEELVPGEAVLARGRSTKDRTRVFRFACRTCHEEYAMTLFERCHYSTGCPRCSRVVLAERAKNPAAGRITAPQFRAGQQRRLLTPPAGRKLPTRN